VKKYEAVTARTQMGMARERREREAQEAAVLGMAPRPDPFESQLAADGRRDVRA